MDNKTFYNMARRHGLNPFAALCQCWHETSGWTSELFRNANNAAGIKAGSNWGGEVYEKSSWEQRADGTKYDAVSAFRSYSSVDAFLADYSAKLAAMYPLCVKRVECFWGVFDGLLTGTYKWATDHEYFRRLAEAAVKLAPEVFGSEADAKLKSSLLYAIEHDYISQGNFATAVEVIGLRRRRTVCLDAGHGGKDPGAVYGGTLEKDIALDVVKRIGTLLANYNVVYTRTDDTFVELPERADVANAAQADLFVSIHCNSAENAGANGVEVYTHTSQSAGAVHAAKAIYNRLLPASGLNGRGVKSKNLAVLRETSMPAVLVELGFISNGIDRAALIVPEWRACVAQAIAGSIVQEVLG